MSNFKKTFWLTTALTAAAAGMTPALAQQTEPTPVPAAAAEEEEEASEAIVVTGSRIRRDDFSSTSPVQIITQESATLEGLIDTTEILQSSAIAAGSFQTNNQLTGFVTTGGGGVNTISLRGLGENRTLVILNGRRAGPAGTRGQVGAVDLNVIPSSVIERTEILKDGASSIYGSDALAGVVNLITRTNLDGAEFSARGTVSEEGGGNQYRIDGAFGKVFDRGYFNVAVEYYKQNVLRRGSRDDTSCAADYLFRASNGARIDHLDSQTGQYKCYNLFANVLRTEFGDLQYERPGFVYPTSAQGNNDPVVGMARQARAGYPATYPYANYEFSDFDRASILSPVERYTVYSSGGFDLTANIEAYGEFLYNHRESEQYGVRQFFPSVSSANPNNRRPDTNTPFAAILPIIPLKSDNAQEVDYFRVVAGLRGDFGGFLEGWNWDLYGQYSKSDGSYTGDIIYNDRVLAITGATACNQAVITVSGGQCANLPTGVPWTSQRILAGQFNAAEQAFLFSKETGTTTYDHMYVEGVVSGDLFELPAGGLGVAVGAQYRKEELDDTPGLNARNSNLWGSTAAGRTSGEDTIMEAFGELEIPILKGIPVFESLTANLSGRYSDYDSYGASETYKVGLNWQIIPSFRVRASKGTSFRAPALYELYLANQTSFLGQASVDPCINWQDSTNPRIQANCAAAGVPSGYTGAGSSSATIITGGGAGVLEAETGESKTVGVIWTPDFLDLSVAVDYFEIGVEDEVRTFGAGNIAQQCFSSPTPYPGNAFCGLLTRGVAIPGGPNQILTINNSYVNVAEQENRGIDLSIRYRQETGIGNFTLTGQFTWQLEDVVNLLGGIEEDENGGTFNYGGPDFTGNMELRYDRNDWTAQWSMDFIGKGSDTEFFGGDVFTSSRYRNIPAGDASNPAVYYKQYTEFTAYHDFTLRRRFDDWSVQVGILNAFDERPPSQSAGQFRIGTAALNAYDVIGRRGYFQVSKRF